jgi:N-acetylneuraminic acid mutarotase
MHKKIVVIFLMLILTTSSLIMIKPAFSSDVDANKMVENTWTEKASMHQARANLGVAVVNGKIYAIGGNSREGSYNIHISAQGSYTGGVTGDTELYNPETNTWTSKNPMKIPMSGFSTVVCQNKIYCIDGGAAMEVYDPEKNNWTVTAPKPVSGQDMALVFQDKVYIIGGATNEVYDPANDSWENKTAMPYPQEYASTCSLNGKFYFIGGRNNATLNQVYDPLTDSWESKASMPTTVYGSAIVFDNKIYVVGIVDRFYQYDWQTQIYDPETDRWSQGVSPPPSTSYPRFIYATTGEWALKRIYLLNEVLRAYDPQTNNWTLCPNIPIDRSDMGFGVLNDKMYAIGGALYTMQTIFASPISGSTSPSQTTEVYTPFGYGTVPPLIKVTSPWFGNYTSGEIAVNFTVNRAVDWMGFSLDGQDNVTVTGNTTLTGLKEGLHDITVYAKDEFGNTGYQTVSFNITAPFPTVQLIAVVSIVSAVIVCIILLIFVRKRLHKKELTN